MTSTARIIRTHKTDRVDLNLFDWGWDDDSDQPAPTPLFDRARENGTHAQVAADYHRTWTERSRFGVTVAEYLDPDHGTVWAVGTVGGELDDPADVFDNPTEAWEYAVGLAASLGSWDEAWDRRVPAAVHHCAPVDPTDPAAAEYVTAA